MANYGALGGVRAGPGRHCCGAAEEAAAHEFHKHEAESFLVFLSWGGVAQPAVALLCAAVFLQDVGKGKGVLCLCPREVTLREETNEDVNGRRVQQ